ncbi:putative alcohol dehydrogenase [Periconia macrospinosa]|uniref:Putative alcohol dehydrogenase n=1 Tax=Periconia macrospinosa TaxID=97972 RepID=A0A2V1DSF3_9PLEO|nr:putative alcohol dehydrogenase [Periconia macrospinosa]
MASSNNRAARVSGVGKSLEIVDVQAPHPGTGQVLVRNHAVAIQPLDAKMLLTGYGPKLDYPAVFGTSGAGVIEKLGDGVTAFAVGDRIVFDTRAYVNPNDNLREGTWQKLVIADVKTAAKIGDTPFEQAVLIHYPLQTAVAALHLFLKMGKPGSGSSEDRVLVWGAGGAVGLYAAQYAKSVGHTVVVTASPRDSERQKKLGASAVIDYKASDAVEKLRDLGPFKYLFTGSGDPASQKALASLLPQPEGGQFGSVLAGDVALPANVQRVYGFFSGASQLDENAEYRGWYYQEYLPKVLREGLVEPAQFTKVPGGLEALQQACADVFEGKVRGKLIVNPQE